MSRRPGACLDGYGRTYETLAKGQQESTSDIQVDLAYERRGKLASERAPYCTKDAEVYTTTFSYERGRPALC